MPAPEKLDPVYLNSRRETNFALGAWVVFAIWVVGVSLKYGYDVNPDDLRITMGMPSWVFWGVGLPWVMANVVTIWFALKFVADDPLEDLPAGSADASRSKPEAGHE